jgi:hypothetical protein
MRHLFLILSTLFISYSASAGVLMLNCTSDWGLHFVVSSDVDTAEIGTATDYGTYTQFVNNEGQLSRSTVELKGTFQVVWTNSGKLKKIVVNHTENPARTWEIAIKKTRTGPTPTQKVYDAAVTEKTPLADGSFEVSGQSNMVCLDSL